MSENLIGLGGASVDTSLYVKSCLWVVWTVSFLTGNFGSSLGFDLMLHWPGGGGVDGGGGGVVGVFSFPPCRLCLDLSSGKPLSLALALS